MSIHNLVMSECDFCDYENKEPCLSCKKYIMYLGYRDGISKCFTDTEEFEDFKKRLKMKTDIEES